MKKFQRLGARQSRPGRRARAEQLRGRVEIPAARLARARPGRACGRARGAHASCRRSIGSPDRCDRSLTRPGFFPLVATLSKILSILLVLSKSLQPALHPLDHGNGGHEDERGDDLVRWEGRRGRSPG